MKKNEGINNTMNSSNFRNSGRGIKRGNNKLKVNIDFYFRLEDENYTYNSSELNLKIAEILNGYEKYLRKYDPEQDQFCDLFARLSRSNFRSRFHLKDKDIQYIREKGMDTIRSHASDFVCEHVWLRLRFPMMVNKLQCAGTLYSWLSMLLAAAVGDACISGIEFQQECGSQKSSRNT